MDTAKTSPPLFPPISPSWSLPISSHPHFLLGVDFTISVVEILCLGSSHWASRCCFTTRPSTPPGPSHNLAEGLGSRPTVAPTPGLPLWSSLHPSLCLPAEDTAQAGEDIHQGLCRQSNLLLILHRIYL